MNIEMQPMESEIVVPNEIVKTNDNSCKNNMKLISLMKIKILMKATSMIRMQLLIGFLIIIMNCKACLEKLKKEIVFDEKKSKDNIKVKVLGKKFSERHYIEVIGIMDERGADIDTKYLQRTDKPIAILSLSKKDYDPDKVKVFAKCNLHDLWTAPLIPVSE